MKLYHYTDGRAALQIIQDGYIMQSDPQFGRDAHHGKGVYLTSKAPDRYTKLQIARNNIDGGIRANMLVKKGRVDFAFEIQIPKSKVRKAPAGKRDVYVYEEGDLWLDNFEWALLKNED